MRACPWFPPSLPNHTCRWGAAPQSWGTAPGCRAPLQATSAPASGDNGLLAICRIDQLLGLSLLGWAEQARCCFTVLRLLPSCPCGCMLAPRVLGPLHNNMATAAHSLICLLPVHSEEEFAAGQAAAAAEGVAIRDKEHLVYWREFRWGRTCGCRCSAGGVPATCTCEGDSAALQRLPATFTLQRRWLDMLCGSA